MSGDYENTYELTVTIAGRVAKLKWFRYYCEAYDEALDIAAHLKHLNLDTSFAVEVYDFQTAETVVTYTNMED